MAKRKQAKKAKTEQATLWSSALREEKSDKTDVLGSYTGVPAENGAEPTQDADDL